MVVLKRNTLPFDAKTDCMLGIDENLIEKLKVTYIFNGLKRGYLEKMTIR